MTFAPQLQPAYDVVIVGSGAAGMVAAIRAADLGCSVAVVEKSAAYGGATANSAGGIWVPMNAAISQNDTREAALAYLRGVTQGTVRDSMLQTYVDRAAGVEAYLAGLDVRFLAGLAYPDYFSGMDGAVRGRSMLPLDRDGKDIAPYFNELADSHPSTRLLNRYALNPMLAAILGARLPGWKKVLAKLIWAYWSDIPWRLKTRKDRKLTMGRSVIGGLRKAMAERDIPLFLSTPMVGLERDDARVSAVQVRHNGQLANIAARKGVILACGGFERSQALRDEYLTVRTRSGDSASQNDSNTGDAIGIARGVGAALDHMEHAWWSPCMVVPGSGKAGSVSHPIFFDRAKPGSICVNQQGRRFTNETVSYDLFGYAMVADQKATGANTPCWMIFDSRFRAKYPAGALLPSWAMPDRAVPRSWWNSAVFTAPDIATLASRIDVPMATLNATVAAFNRAVPSGVDEEFGRGSSDFERAIGDPTVRPNPTMGVIDTAPYYAVRVDLGDLGTRGGLKIDEAGAVLSDDGAPIPGLYAAGDAAATIFGDTYPGGGCAIGPAVVFGYLAATDVAEK